MKVPRWFRVAAKVTVAHGGEKKFGACLSSSGLDNSPMPTSGCVAEHSLKQRSYPPRASRVTGALLALMLASPAVASPVGIDKEAHFLASYGLSLSVSALLEGKSDYPHVWGFGASFAVGILKELADPVFDLRDVEADILGAATGALFHYSIRF